MDFLNNVAGNHGPPNHNGHFAGGGALLNANQQNAFTPPPGPTNGVTRFLNDEWYHGKAQSVPHGPDHGGVGLVPMQIIDALGRVGIKRGEFLNPDEQREFEELKQFRPFRQDWVATKLDGISHPENPERPEMQRVMRRQDSIRQRPRPNDGRPGHGPV
jgi:hypothetical protein